MLDQDMLEISLELRDKLKSRYRLNPNWRISLEGESRAMTMPTETTVFLAGEAFDWETAVSVSSLSDTLWFHSLHYLPHLAQVGDKKLALELARSYAEFIQAPAYARVARRAQPSWDHVTALRLEALSSLIAMVEPGDTAFINAIFQKDLRWALDMSNVRMNNHGLMLVSALAKCAALVEEMDVALASQVEHYAANHIRAILHSVFGDDGYCNENSPFYASFYLRKLRQLKKDVPEFLIKQDIIDEVDGHLKRGTKTLSNILLPDGRIPPMGDSSESQTSMIASTGTFISSRTGFWVHKTDQLYMSLKCGHDSITHKHVDDTSITLRYGASDFFIDSGHHSYAGNTDTKVRMLRTQRGHSGIYYPEYDDVLPAKIYPSGKPNGRLMAMEPDGGVVGVESTYTLDAKHTVYRQLRVFNERNMELVDRFFSIEGKAPLQRFIVPEEADIELEEGKIRITNGAGVLLMTYGYEAEVSVVHAQTKHPYKGWRSKAPNKMVGSQCLELQPISDREHTLRVSIEIHVPDDRKPGQS